MNPDHESVVAATYQYVVVAVVACGVFAAGVTTIMLRRHRRQQMLAAARGGGDGRVLFGDDGYLYDMPGAPRVNTAGAGRTRRKKLGPTPKIWDAKVGGEYAEEADEEIGWEEQKNMGVGLQVGLPASEAPSRATHSLQPVAIAVPAHEAESDDQPYVDVAVLIAMPDPSLSYAADEEYPTFRPPKGVNEDEYEFPPMAVSSLHVPVSTPWADLDALRPPPRERRKKKPAPPQPPRQSAFRRFLMSARASARQR